MTYQVNGGEWEVCIGKERVGGERGRVEAGRIKGLSPLDASAVSDTLAILYSSIATLVSQPSYMADIPTSQGFYEGDMF